MPEKLGRRRGQRDMSLPVHEWCYEVGRPDDGERLDAFLARRVGWRSRSSLRRAIDGGAVEVLATSGPEPGGIGRPRAGLRLRRGQEVRVRLPAPWAESGAGERRWGADEIPWLYCDERLLAVGKPPGCNVYPSRRHRAGSLVELVHERHRRLYGESEFSPSPCHRLDRETSGLVLFARDRGARAEISRQFEERRIGKRYLAWVVGRMEPGEGRIAAPLGPDPLSRVEIKRAVVPAGEAAETAWKVVERRARHTLVELHPRTGRQHQLRAHLASIGYPIVGDKLYLGGDGVFLRSLEGGLSEGELRRLGHPRLALHAWQLELDHPEDGRRIRLESPLWADLEGWLPPAEAEEPGRRDRSAE